MDAVAYILASQRAKKYANSVALNGVPVKGPRINSVTKHWEVFDPVSNAYADTGEIADGKSAYELALQNGFSGTLGQWLASLEGKNGEAPQLRANEITNAVQYRFVNFAPTDWTDLFVIPNSGSDGGNVNIQSISNQEIQTILNSL